MRVRAVHNLKPLAALAAVFLLLGCTSQGVAPAHLGPSSCTVDERFPGTWKSSRRSQLGPATMTFRFRCDCSYTAIARLFILMRIREQGVYWVEDGRLKLSRASGEVTEMPFSFHDEAIVLVEHENEKHTYTRTSSRDCEKTRAGADSRM